jgi:Xaa-Pro aminopeptidase
VSPSDVRPDDRGLRYARRERVLAAMEAEGVDVLVMGREANARYVSGAPRLWTAGSRAFGPGCVLVRATGDVHLLSTWDEGIPEEIPHEHLYGISFNAANFLAALRKVEGASSVRTVATDGLTASASQLLPKAFPSADLVDGEPLLRRARAVKTPDEVAAIRAAAELALRALDDTVAALRPGVTGRALTAVFMESMAAAGVTTPTTQDAAWITSPEHPGRRLGRDTPAQPGHLVAFDAGVIRAGYAGEVGRTHGLGEADAAEHDLRRQAEALWQRLLGACHPGAAATGLLEAYDATGLPPPPTPVARGLGLGFDLPLVTHSLPALAAEQRLEVGMVLALTAFVWKEGKGAVYEQEPVLVAEAGPELLSTDAFRQARSEPT